MPPQHRNVSGIYRFVHSLLLDAETDDCAERIQCISLPRHHLDKPGDHPKCKGFALVTLARFEDVDHLLQLWPWERPRTASASRSEKVPQDAERFGFRTTMKLRWDKLNQEYLSYRQELLDQMAQDTAHDDAEPSTSAVSPPNEAAEAERKDTAPDTPVLDLSAPYPSGCLAFVRHVHPETNKTTLRKLLSQAFSKTESGVSDGGIDYVDFNKGMDTVSVLPVFLREACLALFSAISGLLPHAIPSSSSDIFLIIQPSNLKALTAPVIQNRTRHRSRSSLRWCLDSAKSCTGARFLRKCARRRWRKQFPDVALLPAVVKSKLGTVKRRGRGEKEVDRCLTRLCTCTYASMIHYIYSNPRLSGLRVFSRHRGAFPQLHRVFRLLFLLIPDLLSNRIPMNPRYTSLQHGKLFFAEIDCLANK